MQLIGQYDSPYVRRVAVTLTVLGLAFEHRPLSVFSTYDDFAAINPVVKAPTLVTAEGTVLMDSTLILEHVTRALPAAARLVPEGAGPAALAQRIVGLALAACDKAVQIVYETRLRPEEARHQPWLDRVAVQLAAACRLLEQDMPAAAPWMFGEQPSQADLTTAVAVRFIQAMLPGTLTAGAHPRLLALSAWAEGTAPFLACPHR